MFIKADELIREVMALIEKKYRGRPTSDILILLSYKEFFLEKYWQTVLKQLTVVEGPILVYSSTITINEMMIRLLFAHSKVNICQFFTGIYKDKEFNSIIDAAGFFYTLPIWFTNTDFKCRNIHLVNKYDIIFRVEQ